MKFTEGYWLPSEKANASHAMQAYEVEQIPGGMRILATTRPIEHRGMTLNLPTITVEFVYKKIRRSGYFRRGSDGTLERYR